MRTSIKIAILKAIEKINFEAQEFLWLQRASDSASNTSWRDSSRALRSLNARR